MKKIIILLAVLLLTTESASADKFLDDYNDYAKFVYGIDPVECIESSVASSSYKNDKVTIFHYMWNDDRIIGTDDLEVISAACCVFRCVDNSGDRLDQYGRIMHAYFLAKARDDGMQYHAATLSGYTVWVQISNNTLYIKLVK